MSRCVIFGAAEIKNYEKIAEAISPDDFIVACDGGLTHLENLNQRGLSPLKPHLIIGDFDSHIRPHTSEYPDAQIIQLPREKDDTDVFYAVKEALKRGSTEFLLTGVVGQRFDHSLVNISTLLYLDERGIPATILDDYSEMQLVGTDPVLISDSYSYFSLLCVAGDVSGVTISNAKYPLTDAKITTKYQYAVSNEVLPGKTAEVSVKQGKLLLVRVS